VSSIGDAFAALRKILLIESNVERLQRDVELQSAEIRRVRDYAGSVDSRVTLIEGRFQGFEMARRQPPALPEN